MTSEASPITDRVRAFLVDDFAAIDPQLPSLLAILDERRAAEDWHKHGTFKEHLLGVYRILSLWRQPKDVCLCGLLHSVYSNEYVDLALFDAKAGRGSLQQLVGPETEELIFLFCTMPRSQFAIDLLEAESAPTSGMVLRDSAGASGREVRLSAAQTAKFLIVTLADLAEQFFSWQDEVMARYPYVPMLPAAEHWSAALWPGACRPSAWMPSVLSRLARHLPQFDVELPPIFDRCTGGIVSAEDAAAAAALYWQVVAQSGPLVSAEHAEATLRAAIRHNPWMAEPHLLLAQLAMLRGDFPTGEHHAGRGLRLLCDWGTPWDKRVSWAGWVAWARILLQRANARSWPPTLREHNNLGLVQDPPTSS